MSKSGKALFLILVTVSCIAFSSGAFAQAPPPPPKPWSYALAFSYLGTTGNTDTQTFGTEFTFKRLPEPWGIEGGVSYLRGEQNGDLTAERTKVAVKGMRAFGVHWEYFVGASWEQDKFSGFDSRITLATGATYKALTGPKNELAFDLGLSWTDEEYVYEDSDSFVGGFLALRYAHNWTPKSKFLQRLLYIPNFEEGSAWRGESETAVLAALTDRLALKGSFLLRYDNEPPPGFEETDTTTALSIVFSF